MIYLQRSNYGRRRRILIPATVVLIVLGSIWGLHSARSSVASGIVYYIAVPLWKAEDFLAGGLDASLTFFTSKRKIEAERKLMEERVKAAELKALTAESYLKENEALKATLRRLGEDASNYIVAYVLAGPPRTLYDTFIVDAGKNVGVTVGMKVVAENVAFGEIVEVGADVSKIRLYSSPEAQTEVLVGSHDARLLAKGRGGGNFVIEVPKGITVKEGEVIRLPGGAITILGIVGHVESKAADPFDRVFVTAPVNVFEVPFVLVDTRTGFEMSSEEPHAE